MICFNKGGAFFFPFLFYSPSSGVFFELLSWGLFFWVGMMISRTGWISVGASRLYFLRGEENVVFVFFLGEIRLCNGDAWLGPGVHGERCVVAVPFCDGAMLKSCKH